MTQHARHAQHSNTVLGYVDFDQILNQVTGCSMLGVPRNRPYGLRFSSRCCLDLARVIVSGHLGLQAAV